MGGFPANAAIRLFSAPPVYGGNTGWARGKFHNLWRYLCAWALPSTDPRVFAYPQRPGVFTLSDRSPIFESQCWITLQTFQPSFVDGDRGINRRRLLLVTPFPRCRSPLSLDVVGIYRDPARSRTRRSLHDNGSAHRSACIPIRRSIWCTEQRAPSWRSSGSRGLWSAAE